MTKGIIIRVVVVIGCCWLNLCSYGQGRGEKDSTAVHHRGLKNNNIFQFFRNSITKGRPDSIAIAAALNTKSESPFKPYEGKVIRHIFIRGYGFEQTFTDTSRRLQYFGTKVLNQLHRKTRDWVIRNNLFIKENTAVNAYKLADNERLIRNLNFIQDARILVTFVPETDSVDLVVVVKDLFTIGGAIGSLGYPPFSIRGNVSEANFLGMGQRIQGGFNLEQNRDPNFGPQLLYSKTNIAGSFVNATASYTKINGDLYPGTPDETAWFVRLDRPLYAPYAHLAGGFTIGHFENFNVYHNVDSVFYKYSYHTHDGWIGWNLGSDRFLSNTSVRDRKFVAFRYFRNDFDSVPKQIGKDNFNFRFNNREAALASFTFFRQDFYKTNYIYGFGTTEDIPMGYNVAFTGGWYKQLYLTRPYVGVDANEFVVTKKGAFVQFFLRSGTFMRKGRFEDASTLVGASYYSPLFVFSAVKIRQYINFSYTRQFNRLGIDPLTINNVFGLRYFSGDSTFGSQRMTLHSETTFFLNYKFLGFKFAPFAFGDLSFLTPEKGTFDKSSLYHGIGAGIRARNENLVFNTIELRMVYFPRKTMQNNSFKIMFSTGIQFRYNNTYVRQPDVVYLNTDGLNSIY
ncbi:MAG TPA: hypothetical protein VL727_09760 [Puia sp.]|nr:hypothetical protein [Puia sp.]